MYTETIIGAIAALITGVTSRSAWDYYKQRRLGDERKDNALIEAKDSFIEDLQRRYIHLETRIGVLHDEFLAGERERAQMSGTISELRGKVEQLEQKVSELEVENRILKSENEILKNK